VKNVNPADHGENFYFTEKLIDWSWRWRFL